jgi:hypothetical protein
LDDGGSLAHSGIKVCDPGHPLPASRNEPTGAGRKAEFGIFNPEEVKQ